MLWCFRSMTDGAAHVEMFNKDKSEISNFCRHNKNNKLQGTVLQYSTSYFCSS